MRHAFLFLLIYSMLAVSGQEGLRSTLPATITAGTELRFQVTITKGHADNFSKYQVDLPPGVSVSEVDSKGGAFSFENNRGKVIWVNTPQEREFTITLSLKTGTFTGQGYIHQKFYFIDNETRRELELGPIAVLFTAGSASTATPAPVVSSYNAATAAKPDLEAKKKATAATSATAGAAKEPVSPLTGVKTTTDGGNIVYRVQLSSGTEKPSIARYAGIAELEVVKEANLYKVLAGHAGSKEEAVRLRNELAAKGFSGFVVAYQNGQRVK